MPAIERAEDAINIAEQLVARYYPLHRLVKAVKEEGAWLVEFDVSILLPRQIIRIRLDPSTGDLIDYTEASKP